MTAIRNKPPHWRRMPYTARAAFLVASHQARDYSEACSMLARGCRKKPRPEPVPVTPNNRWDLAY